MTTISKISSVGMSPPTLALRTFSSGIDKPLQLLRFFTEKDPGQLLTIALFFASVNCQGGGEKGVFSGDEASGYPVDCMLGMLFVVEHWRRRSGRWGGRLRSRRRERRQR